MAHFVPWVILSHHVFVVVLSRASIILCQNAQVPAGHARYRKHLELETSWDNVTLKGQWFPSLPVNKISRSDFYVHILNLKNPCVMKTWVTHFNVSDYQPMSDIHICILLLCDGLTRKWAVARTRDYGNFIRLVFKVEECRKSNL